MYLNFSTFNFSVSPIGSQYKSYLSACSVTVCLILGLCFLINFIMDPLWYFYGNMIEEKNYGFNERLTKTNQFLKTAKKYDCIIFGSSRTTLLNESLIENYQCFNFAFASGQIREFNAFAEYILEQGVHPRRVVVGVDDFNFIYSWRKINIPDYIKNKSTPPSFIKVYLSLDGLGFSYRLLKGDSPFPRYYDNNFLGNIIPNAKNYSPTLKMKDHVRIRENPTRDYMQLRKLFSEAEFIGYVPPISAWRIASKSEKELKNYLGSVYRISRFISPFYDFSIPSTITSTTDNTYDGSHYSIATNRFITDRINEKSQLFGIRVDTMSKDEYFRVYQQSLKSFMGE